MNGVSVCKCKNEFKKKHVFVYVGCNGGSICKASSHKAIWLFGSQQLEIVPHVDGGQSTFALCGLLSPYLPIAGPTLWN